MAKRQRQLNVVLGDRTVATLSERRGKLELKYADWVLDELRGQRVLSCSLPVTAGADDARNFFDGVLPEGDFRDRIASRAGVVASDTFSLLARYGRDIAGALTVEDPEDEGASSRPGVVGLSDADLRDEVEALPSRPLGIRDDSELSIAGLQNKLLLVRGKDGWARPVGGAPSTHILKLDSQAHRGVVRAEAAIMQLARIVGLTSVEVDVLQIGEMDCIIVERFDRIRSDSDGTVERVHQEDMCQALGLPPTQKYELPGRGRKQHGGGPEFSQVAALLDRHSSDPVADLCTLARVAAFTAITGNSDAHGKNLALLYDANHRVRLAPLYDTVPTILFPRLKDQAAMTIGGAVDLALVGKRTLATEARHWNVDPEQMVSEAESLANLVLENAAKIDDFPGVRDLVTSRAKAFLAS